MRKGKGVEKSIERTSTCFQHRPSQQAQHREPRQSCLESHPAQRPTTLTSDNTECARNYFDFFFSSIRPAEECSSTYRLCHWCINIKHSRGMGRKYQHDFRNPAISSTSRTATQREPWIITKHERFRNVRTTAAGRRTFFNSSPTNMCVCKMDLVFFSYDFLNSPYSVDIETGFTYLSLHLFILCLLLHILLNRLRLCWSVLRKQLEE